MLQVEEEEKSEFNINEMLFDKNDSLIEEQIIEKTEIPFKRK